MANSTSQKVTKSKSKSPEATDAQARAKPSPVVAQSETLVQLQQLGREKRVVDEIRRGHSALCSRHHRELRGELARLYDVAWFLREEPDAWFDFCRDPEWGSFRRRPKEHDREHALRFVIRMAVGFDGRSSTNLVNKYIKRTEGFFDARIAPNRAREKILQAKDPEEQGGVDDSKRHKARARRRYATIRIPYSAGGKTFLSLDGKHVAILLKIIKRRGPTRVARMEKYQLKDKRANS